MGKKILCKTVKSSDFKKEFGKYIKMVKKGKYVCESCGRVAKKKKNLCKPQEL